MNYINLQHCINQKLFTTSKAFNIMPDMSYLNYEERLKHLQLFAGNDKKLSQLMFHAYKNTIESIADKVLDDEFNTEKFVLYFPYNKFPNLYK